MEENSDLYTLVWPTVTKAKGSEHLRQEDTHDTKKVKII